VHGSVFWRAIFATQQRPLFLPEKQLAINGGTAGSCASLIILSGITAMSNRRCNGKEKVRDSVSQGKLSSVCDIEKTKQLSMHSFFSMRESKRRRTLNGMKNDVSTMTPPTPFQLNRRETPPSLRHRSGPITPPSVSAFGEQLYSPRHNVSDEKGRHPSVRQPSQKSKSLKQLYLDLGQADFGKQTICGVCGMLFVHGLAEDTQEHEKICRDYTQGITFRSQHARNVATFPNGAIFEVGITKGCS